MAPRLLLGLALVGACTYANPSYDDGAGESASSGPTQGTTGVTQGGTSAATTPDTSTSATPSTSGTSTSSASTSTTATTTANTSDATTDGTSDATTDGAGDCWDQDPRGWEVTALPGNFPIELQSPRIDPGGLQLLYGRSDDGTSIVQAKRPDNNSDFTLSGVFHVWGDVLALDYANLRDKEFIAAVITGPESVVQIAIATDTGNGWSPFTVSGPPVNPGSVAASTPSLTEDGARLLYAIQDGAKNEFLGPTWRIYEASRAADSPAGTPFDEVSLVTFPDFVDGETVTLCPVISPDGLRLFFGSSYPEVLTMATAMTELVNVYYRERVSVDDPWGPILKIDALDDTDDNIIFNTCPSSITRDGCELYFFRFQFPPGEYKSFRARRSP